jgi:carboxylesterase type B
MFSFALFAMSIIGQLASAADHDNGLMTVSVSSPAGTIIGKTADSVNSFLGIPFAEPPIGNLRFKPPKPISHNPQSPANNATVMATSFKPSCWQRPPTNGSLTPIEGPISEDCLFLNIWTPSSAKQGDNLPVMVWVHGGAFKDGGPSAPNTNGALFLSSSKDPVIVVSIAYRLNVFGFLASEELKNEKATNLGLQDQAVAFEWVRNHISYFGGNPHKVTGFGQSAGAFSLSTHLVMQYHFAQMDSTFVPYFDQIILESPTIGVKRPNVSQSEKFYERVLKSTNCTDLACLRTVSAESLYQAGLDSEANFGPVVDGVFITDNMFTLFKNGRYLKVPTMLGTNANEGTFFCKKAPPYQEYISTHYAAYTSQVIVF